ncbi:DUF3869 domain-containing protein [Mangrovimonas sp. CR14]|uniref:DUF6252 family protein n=1 Tax=Mangrovimonas sp. CR14 TaxID=2706120 RepID=UPI00141EBD64|nr:DUF6252 family protein [Mangrovimonas sp. CR14]NIK93131.1 DUF3869 domain-containing protein [Mangrovimonas sp. CR14]
MKTFKLTLMLFMALGFVTLTSCKKDDDGGDPGDTQAASGTITAKINGESFTSLEITSFATVQSGGGNTVLVMQGNSSSQAINIQINYYDGVGTYDITDESVFILASYIEPNTQNPAQSQTWSAPFDASGVVGEINISEETDATIKGTFQFTAKNPNDGSTREVTDGSFNLNKM